jgi:uncharacterized damage-inducible protein DinB
MKQLLQQYAAYNIWANKLLVELINKLAAEKIMQEMPSSFSSIYKTIQHMWLAEEAWWQRLKLVESVVLQSEKFTGSFTDLSNLYAKQSLLFKEWIDAATDNQLTHTFAYMRGKEQQKIAVHDMLLHVFNHGAYHRGQLVNILRQLGETDKIPSTDFAAYCRTRK